MVRSKHGGWRKHESKPPTMPDNPSYPKKVLIDHYVHYVTCSFQDPRWEMEYNDYNDLGFKVSNLPQKQNHNLFQVGGAALMPSTILNPHVTAELPAREWRN